MLRNPKLDRQVKGFSKRSMTTNIFNYYFTHVFCMMVVPLTHHAIFLHTIPPLPHLCPSSTPPPVLCSPYPRPGVWNGSTTRGVVFALCGRYFHSPTDTKELLYDPASVMNGDTLKFCLKEAWCKLSFFVLSFFYYLYWWAHNIRWGGYNWITCKEITLIWLQRS